MAAERPADLLSLNLDFERGPMIVDDLRRLPAAPLVVADGTTILPELVGQDTREAIGPSGCFPPSNGTVHSTRQAVWRTSSSTAGSSSRRSSVRRRCTT